MTDQAAVAGPLHANDTYGGPLLGLPPWDAGAGKTTEGEEETFYVGADVKLFLSALRAEAIWPLAPTKRPLRAATVLRALEGVRRIRLTRPSLRVGLFPPNT
jgi:hypothetical protein